ncbi:MAG: hypothetical protein ACLGI6_06280 [Gammaproteobacteria bacterium]
MATRNRVLELLKPGATLNGIDFVEVRADEPEHLYVHFFNAVPVAQPDLHITVTGGDLIPTVEVATPQAADWSQDIDARQVLRLTVPGRGDFSTYTLRIIGAAALDPFLSSAAFSFFVFCPSITDCRQDPPDCPPPEGDVPPIDYLAKDYESFRAALSDFSTLRYPEWRERSEADFGMVMMDALSAIGDQLSYIQDQLHLQANIETASTRAALVRLARLVDYEPGPVVSASALVTLDVSATGVPAGVRIDAVAPDGSPVPFETGAGLRDAATYRVNPACNGGMPPYWWDDEERCLDVGARTMALEGHGYALQPGQQVLIDTAGPSTADPPLRQLLVLTAVQERHDPLFGVDITEIHWRVEDALRAHHDLTRTRVLANLVPVTQGLRRQSHFAVGVAPPSAPGLPLAVARLGPNSTADEARWQYWHSIEGQPLAYLPDAGGTPRPEVRLRQLSPEVREWRWVRTLLAADRAEACFTIEPGHYRDVARLPEGVFSELDAEDGALLAFGTGEFGAIPNDGDVFQVESRSSRGQVGLVPAEAITQVDPAWSGLILAATNPLPASGGQDAETAEQVRRRAPYAFQNLFFRAVRPEDYDAAANRLPWVQRAGTVFRWTGSWPTVFTTADPVSAGAISTAQHIELIALLNRVRLAGYEAYAPRPRYVSFDLLIRLCAKPGAFKGDVYSGVEYALRPVRHADGSSGFFFFDNFTLGSPFERSRLEAALQAVPGVSGVLSIRYRRRGQSTAYLDLPPVVPFAPGEIFRLDNDNNHPERGSYRLDILGTT